MRATFVEDKRNDLQTVNAARVSFGKISEEFTFRKDTKNSDEGLVSYLYSHDHWTPLSHSRELFSSKEKILNLEDLTIEQRTGLVYKQIDSIYYIKHSLWGWIQLLTAGVLKPGTDSFIYSKLKKVYPNIFAIIKGINVGEFDVYSGMTYLEPNEIQDVDLVDFTLHEKVPIFVARQRFKHVVGNVYNEISRRYVDHDPEFFMPVWRERPDKSIKQGSGGEFSEEMQVKINLLYEHTINSCAKMYNKLLKMNVAPEQARALLPQSMYTEYYVTGNLAAWKRAYDLRSDGHAQDEIRVLASQWNEVLSEHSDLWKQINKDSDD